MAMVVEATFAAALFCVEDSRNAVNPSQLRRGRRGDIRNRVKRTVVDYLDRVTDFEQTFVVGQCGVGQCGVQEHTLRTERNPQRFAVTELHKNQPYERFF
jgi:hypothetical protein